jgi:hypothetical protein
VSSTGSATDGINLDGLGAGTFSASSGDVQGATSRGFRANSGTGDISYGGSISDGPGSTAAITGRSGGTVTLSGSLADGSDAGGGIAISGNSGGASVFSHGSKVINAGSGDGVLMTNNTGHSVTFSGGGLGIAATSGKGMEAMGGGTLTVTGSGNTIDTATGRTLNVDSTNIGSDGLNFRSIGAGTAAGGPVNGIRLNGTGGAGSLFVSGGGTAGSGGTIQKTTGDGVSLKDTTAPTLAYMAIYDSADNGIAADSVSDLAIQYDDLQRNGAQAEAGAVNDAGIHLGNITGTSAILVTNVSDSHNSNIDWDASSGTGRLNVAASTIDSSGENPGEGGAGVSLTATGTASPYLNLSSANEVNSNNQEGVRVSSDSGTPTARVENSDVKSNGGAGVNLTASGTAQALYRVSGSNLQGNGGRSIALNSSGTPAVDGSVSGNTIGTSGVAGSGSGSAEAVFAELDDGTNGALAVTGNTIFAPATAGIAVFSADQSGTEVAPIDLTIRDNTVGPPTTAANGHGVDVFAGGNNHVCLDIAGNDADGVGGTEHQFEDLHVKQSGTSTFSLERFTGDGADDSAVESFLLAQNPASDTADAEHTTGFTGVDDATCQSPELP